MSSQKINQKENIVGRDQAAHDINYNYYYDDSLKTTYMSRLIEKYKFEKQNDIEFHDRIEKLRHYSTPPQREEIAGLEEKLINADYDYLVDFAKQTKEIFSKKLAKYEFYESAQEIYAYILADIYSRFQFHIIPLIREGISTALINKAIQENIIDPVLRILEINILNICSDEIHGMLYFLTGNCHLKWK